MMIDENENPRKKVNSKIVVTLLLYCTSGTLLTLLNKLSVIVFPFTNMLLFLQNGVAVILLLINYYFFPAGSESFPKINYEILKIWIPVVLLFVTMLSSSLFALTYVSVSTLIVIRNLSTLSVAVLEYFILGSKIDILSICTLIGMLLGAIFYSMHDLTFHTKGYIWLCVNIIGTSLYQIYIKKVINMSTMIDHGAISMSFYNNLISLPILLILSFLMGEFKFLLIYFQSIYLPEIRSICIVFLSCILGFALSTSAFSLNKQISPTSMMVANNVNKFTLIILSEIIVEWTLDISSSIGAIFVLFCGWLYSQTKEYFSKYLFFFATILFLTLYTSLESKHLIIQMINQKFFSGFNFVTQSNMSFFKNMTNLFNNESKIINID